MHDFRLIRMRQHSLSWKNKIYKVVEKKIADSSHVHLAEKNAFLAATALGKVCSLKYGAELHILPIVWVLGKLQEINVWFVSVRRPLIDSCRLNFAKF
jgi:hypothetical protein